MIRCCVLMLAAAAIAAAQTGTPKWSGNRLIDELNWMEFRDVVPSQVKTVLLTVGTLEPHGVANNGADNTAPVAMARAIAAEVNALIAPDIPYGITGSMAAYPGAMQIPEPAFRVRRRWRPRRHQRNSLHSGHRSQAGAQELVLAGDGHALPAARLLDRGSLPFHDRALQARSGLSQRFRPAQSRRLLPQGERQGGGAH
jgi:hypothetical protein